MAVVFENSKDAVTHFKVLERYGHQTLVECNLETGRTHQIVFTLLILDILLLMTHFMDIDVWIFL